MALFNTLKFLHVLSVICWLGGGAFVVVMSMSAARQGITELGVVAATTARAGKVFGALAGIAFVTGVLMVITTDGPGEFEDGWIITGIVVFLISAIVGGRGLGKAYEAVAAAAAEGNEATVAPLAQRARMLSLFDLALITIAVAGMVFKWG